MPNNPDDFWFSGMKKTGKLHTQKKTEMSILSKTAHVQLKTEEGRRAVWVSAPASCVRA